MFPTDKSIENLQQLFGEVKKYLALQKEYTLLEVSEKLTILLSTLILILIVIILSMVRDNEAGSVGFLSDVRRANVAMTRARAKLIIVGNSVTLGKNRFYGDLYDYISRVGRVVPASLYINKV